jgi:N-acetylglucosaminyl-diphospho-decaprenol L-rhamnosyltransferase
MLRSRSTRSPEMTASGLRLEPVDRDKFLSNDDLMGSVVSPSSARTHSALSNHHPIGPPVSPKTHVVIVNYRTADLAVQAVESVEAQRDLLGGGRVFLVDNASGDGSDLRLAEVIASRDWSPWVELLPQPLNGGFSYGNNRGFDRIRALGDFGRANLLLLNPDAQLLPGCLASALALLNRQPQAGIVSVPISDGHGVIESSAHQWPSPLSELVSQAHLGLLSKLLSRHDVSPARPAGDFSCDWVSGAFFLIRAEAAAQVGNMDEGYFLYFEEVDYCRQAVNAGWQVWMADGPGVVHFMGSSTGIAEAAKPRAAYWYDSRRRFLQRHYGTGGLIAADVLSLLGRAIYLPRKWLKLGSAQRPDQQPLKYHRLMVYHDLKALLSR